MAVSPDLIPRDPRHKMAVRLLFLGTLLFFFAGWTLRKYYREPYPALLMPSFAGTGLAHMTRQDGESSNARITVTFADHTTAEISLRRLAGNIFPPLLLKHLFQQEAGSTLFHPITPDTKRYLHERLQSLFPGRTPESIQFQIYLVRVPLDHPQSPEVLRLITQRTVSLNHENAD